MRGPNAGDAGCHGGSGDGVPDGPDDVIGVRRPGVHQIVALPELDSTPAGCNRGSHDLAGQPTPILQMTHGIILLSSVNNKGSNQMTPDVRLLRRTADSNSNSD